MGYFKIQSILYLFIFLFIGCTIFQNSKNAATDLNINLRWSKSFDGETSEMAEIGLEWMMSYLGASLQDSSFYNSMSWKTNEILTINLRTVGFNENSLKVWEKLIPQFKATEEYSKMGGIDLGRFYLLTSYSSWHYYAITGVHQTFDKFLSAYQFEEPIMFFRNESNVAYGDRKVFLGKNSTDLDKMAFYAIEGSGSIKNNTFVANDFEAYDFMPNGQPRFAIYAPNGQLKAAADPSLGKGGKPAKCMWCHESTIQRNFKKKKAEKLASFNVEIIKRKEILRNLQREINTSVIYDSLLHHRNMEFSSISFMESNPMNIVNEFKISKTKVELFLDSLDCKTTHHYPEFGCYYDRSDIAPLQPYKSIQVPTHYFEQSEYEPNLLK